LKARDGATRAAEAAVLWLMSDLGFAVDVELGPVRNHAGREVGAVRVVA
jgi:L-asparaginase II